MRGSGCTQGSHSMFLPLHIDGGACSSLSYMFCWVFFCHRNSLIPQTLPKPILFPCFLWDSCCPGMFHVSLFAWLWPQFNNLQFCLLSSFFPHTFDYRQAACHPRQRCVRTGGCSLSFHTQSLHGSFPSQTQKCSFSWWWFQELSFVHIITLCFMHLNKLRHFQTGILRGDLRHPSF